MYQWFCSISSGLELEHLAGEYENYGGPQLSRQNKKSHGKNKKPTAKQKASRQKQKTHGNIKSLTAKTKSPRQKQKAHGKRNKLTAKPTSLRQKQKAHGKSAENLTARAKSKGDWVLCGDLGTERNSTWRRVSHTCRN